MTLTPDFEFGLWNAWIVVVTFLIGSFLPFFVMSQKADANSSPAIMGRAETRQITMQ